LQQAVERLGSLMNDFLLLGRPTASAWTSQPLPALLGGAIDEIEALASSRQVTVAYTGQSLEPVLPVQARRLQVAISNLLRNAVQMSPPGGEVRVGLEIAPDRSSVLLEVRDSGAGFREDEVDRVFEPFFSRRPGGTGLGLAIVRQVVEEEHQGKIRASNHPEGGGLMTIELPIRQDPFVLPQAMIAL